MKFVSPLMLATICVSGLLMMASFAAAEEVDLKVGDAAPKFEAKTDEGKAWKSADFAEKTLVVYFYPAAMTGGCTKQACAYRDDREKLVDQGVEVVAVSGDQPAGLALFKKAEKLNFTLLSDPDGAVAKKFGVPVGEGGKLEREVDGQKHTLERGVSAKRWTFVIRDGKVIYKNTAVDAAGDSKAILTFLEKQKKE
jgi:peroxiredoxin Q/BCP